LIIYSVESLPLLPVTFIYFCELILGFVTVFFKHKHEHVPTRYILL